MNITIVGSGNMGSGFVRQLSAAGHRVTVTGRDLRKATALAEQHRGVRALEAATAAREADVIVLATPYDAAASALRSLGDLQGKLVMDVTNPLTADYMGLTLGHDTSGAEEIARAVPGAIVVKAFNTVFAQVLGEGPDFGAGRKVPVFVASDDAQAKDVVKALAQGIGFDVIDAGPLKNARYLEPLAGLNIYLGYGAGLGTAIAPTWIRKS
jgi:8-hydroxy-5-deazaflavin:NADPH oxidoreductase